MKTCWVVLISVVLTLGAQALLLQSWLIRGLVLDLVDDPRPDYDHALVLTKPVELRYNEKKVGELEPGQILFAPSRHDLFLTEPFNPRVWKIYVEFGSSARWDGYTATIKETAGKLATRQRLDLTPNTSSELDGAANGSQPFSSETNTTSSAAGSRR